MENATHPPNYDRFPAVAVPAPHSFQCWSGWAEICERLRAIAPKEGVIAVECYPGVLQAEISQTLAAALKPACTLDSRAVFLPPYDVDCLVEGDLGGWRTGTSWRSSPARISCWIPPRRPRQS